MAASNLDLEMLVVRWLHLVAGIMWIGILYWFNLVNVPFGKSLDGPTRNQVIPRLLPRSLWWFRWGAMVTILSGIFLMDLIARNKYGSWGNFSTSEQGRTIMLGGLLGLIMWTNVWFVIWPNQRKVIAATDATARTGAPAPAEQPRWARRAYLASRTNFALSFPMLVMMASSARLDDFQAALILAAAAFVGGLIWVWYLGQPKKAPTPPSAAPGSAPRNP